MLRFASAVFAIYECDVMPVHEDDHLLSWISESGAGRAKIARPGNVLSKPA